jgi:hypothetical protein
LSYFVATLHIPATEIHRTAVVDIPLSDEVTRATCFLPLRANVLEFLPGTVDIDVEKPAEAFHWHEGRHKIVM